MICTCGRSPPIWRRCPRTSPSTNVCFGNGFAPQVLDRLQHCLAGHFDVEHSTFQLEPASHQTHEPGAHP